jgi:inorganic pyrophosphatase
MRDEKGPDAKVLAVPAGDPRWSHIEDLEDMPSHLRAEIEHFFEVYKALEPGKYSSTHGIGGRDDAWREIDEARVNFTAG